MKKIIFKAPKGILFKCSVCRTIFRSDEFDVVHKKMYKSEVKDDCPECRNDVNKTVTNNLLPYHEQGYPSQTE